MLTHLRAAGEHASAADWTDTDVVVDPRPEPRGTYEDLFVRYRAHRTAARPLCRDSSDPAVT